MYRFRHGDRPLPGYTILRGVGRGAFGEVYYASSDAGREVALKMILRNEEIELRGVLQCINLKSPNLVSIFDVRNAEDGTPFVIMEYVKGPSLRELIRAHPGGMGEQKSAYIVREIAKGLAYLHERGIVHRDLKPENIFYEDGYVKIGDYGLSKLMSLSIQSGHTISVGTVHYMAPEIGTGNYRRTVDIYALGVIAYELLTGRVPFEGDSFGEILMKHLTMAPDLSRIPDPFRAAVDGALRKDPKERFAEVDAMVKVIFDHAAIALDVTRFDPTSLTQIGVRNAPEDAVLASASAPVPGRPPAWAAPPSPGAREPQPPSAPRPLSGSQETASQTPGPLTALANMMKAQACRFGQWARARPWRGIPGIGETIDAILKPLSEARHGPAEVAPGPAARFFWVFVGSGLLAGALACIAAPMLTKMRDDETFAFVAFGVAMLGYACFAFYRGLRARHRSLWRRTLRPFLFASCAVAALVSVAFLWVGPGYGVPPRLHHDELIAASVAIGIAAAVAGFLILAEFLLSRCRARQPESELGLPRHERSVPMAIRAWDLCLGTACGVAAAATATAGLVVWDQASRASPEAIARVLWEVWAWLGCAVATGALSCFFVRQASRPRRGYLWEGTMRPFLIASIVGTLLVCALPFPLGLPLRDDEGMALIVVASIAVGFSIPILILRGPVAHPQRKSPPARPGSQ